jgi:hypothetical protein
MRRTDPLKLDIVPRSAGTLYGRRVRQDWPADRDFRILSIDGGGIRGILPLAALARLERDWLQGRSIASYFDLVTGTSTGGIIALGLACGLTAQNVLDIYLKRGVDVFPRLGRWESAAKGFGQIIFNRCDSAALYKLIEEVVGKRALWESKVRLCIPAAETRRFEPFLFKTPHHPDYKMDWVQPMALVAKTTSAAPAHFKPVVGDDGYEYIDGGIWANNPVMLGVADALACFDIRREQIRVLSMGCGRTTHQMTWARRHLGGLFYWRSLILEAMDIQSQNVIGQARLIAGGDRVLRIDGGPMPEPIELWNWERAATELPAAGEELVAAWGDVPANWFLRDLAASYKPIYTPTSTPL